MPPWRRILRPSKRVPWIVAAASFAAIAVEFLARLLFLHWDDPRLINDTVACIPVVLTIVIAFVPNLSKAHTIWRIGIVAVGLAWSILLWKQQVQAGHDQENAMARVLKEANEHSDKQMATRIATLPGDVANAVVLKMSPQKTRGTIEIPSSKPAKEASAPSVKNENQTADQKSTAEDVARGLQDIKNLIVGQHWGLTEDQLMFLSQKVTAQVGIPWRDAS